MVDVLVYDSETQAQADADLIFDRLKAKVAGLGYAIHADGSIIGKSAFTGEDAPDKQRTVRWAEPVKRDAAWAAEDETGTRVPDDKWEVPSPAAKHPDIRIDDIDAAIESRGAAASGP